MTSPEPSSSPGTVDGRYVTREELGRGGMGIVYRAKDRLTEREIALKVLPKSSSPLETRELDTKAQRDRWTIAHEFRTLSSLPRLSSPGKRPTGEQPPSPLEAQRCGGYVCGRD